MLSFFASSVTLSASSPRCEQSLAAVGFSLQSLALKPHKKIRTINAILA